MAVSQTETEPNVHKYKDVAVTIVEGPVEKEFIVAETVDDKDNPSVLLAAVVDVDKTPVVVTFTMIPPFFTGEDVVVAVLDELIAGAALPTCNYHFSSGC